MKSSTSFLKKYSKRLPVGLLILLIIFITAISLFAYITHQVLWLKEQALDNYIFTYTERIHSPALTTIMKGVTFCASSIFLQISYALVSIIFLFKKDWKRSLEIAAIGVGGYIVNYVMKVFFQRSRPSGQLVEQLHNYSFLSGHATSAFIFYGMLAYLLWKSEVNQTYKYIIGTLLLIFSILIGFSRVYLRVHFPSDVVAGFCIGFMWLFLTVFVFEKLKKKTDRELKGLKMV